MKKRLAIVTTHPIQYHAPWFRLLTERNKLDVMVFYTWGQVEKEEKYDPGFGKNIDWDIPLLAGYEYTFVKNVSLDPGSHHYKGIDNPGLIKEIEKWGADAILTFGWNFKSHFKAMRHFSGKIPALFRGDSTLQNEPSLLRRIARKTLLTYVYKHVDKALYVGTLNKAYFKKFGVQEEQLVFAPHAIDNERFSTVKTNGKKPEDIRASMSIPGDAFVLLFAGKLEYVKNTGILLKAFKELNIKNAHLVIAGNGILESDLKEIAGGNDTIHFIPFQNQSVMPALYRVADVFVLPSFSETWGLAVNEAMASGKAVLVSDRCGCAADLVQDGINGYVFESNNAGDLAIKIKQLSEQKDTLVNMGNASRNIIQNWSFVKICEAIEQSISNRKG